MTSIPHGEEAARVRPSTLRRSWPSLEQLWAIATVALLMLRVQLTPIAPNDFWWHIATGRIIVETGRVPTVDQFSYTEAGTPYFNQPWLAQVLMYGGYELGGAALLELLQAVLIGATFALMYRICRDEGAGPRASTLATLGGALIAMGNWQIRPQTYALPLFVGALAVLLRWRRGAPAHLWLLPLLMLVWVNLHGTFTLLLALEGLIFAGAALHRWRHGAGRSWRELGKLAAWSIATLGATLLNPRGLGIWRYVGGLLSNRSVGELVTEWVSPFRDLGSPNTLLFFALLGLFCGLMLWRLRRVTVADLVLVLPFLLLALQSVRNILWFGLAATALTARLLAAPQTRSSQRRTELIALNRMIAGLLGLLLLSTAPWWKADIGLPPAMGALLSAETPIAAVEQLRALPERPERLFHEMGFGSYLAWAVPEQRVFVDPRIELYPYDQWIDYIRLGQGQQVDELTKKYGFDGWLLNPVSQQPLIEALEADARWQRVFSTPAAVYFAPR